MNIATRDLRVADEGQQHENAVLAVVRATLRTLLLAGCVRPVVDTLVMRQHEAFFASLTTNPVSLCDLLSDQLELVVIDLYKEFPPRRNDDFRSLDDLVCQVLAGNARFVRGRWRICDDVVEVPATTSGPPSDVELLHLFHHEALMPYQSAIVRIRGQLALYDGEQGTWRTIKLTPPRGVQDIARRFRVRARVVVIEKDPGRRAALVKGLKQWGWRIVAVTSGEELGRALASAHAVVVGDGALDHGEARALAREIGRSDGPIALAVAEYADDAEVRRLVAQELAERRWFRRLHAVVAPTLARLWDLPGTFNQPRLRGWLRLARIAARTPLDRIDRGDVAATMTDLPEHLARVFSRSTVRLTAAEYDELAVLRALPAPENQRWLVRIMQLLWRRDGKAYWRLRSCDPIQGLYVVDEISPPAFAGQGPNISRAWEDVRDLVLEQLRDGRSTDQIAMTLRRMWSDLTWCFDTVCVDEALGHPDPDAGPHFERWLIACVVLEHFDRELRMGDDRARAAWRLLAHVGRELSYERPSDWPPHPACFVGPISADGLEYLLAALRG